MTDRRLALVVAVDSYDHPALHRLAAPAADAAALADILGDDSLGGFEVDTLHNPTSWTAAERVEATLADRHSTDLVLLHFSCHGLKDDAGELYLAATNTRPDLLGSTAIDAAWVNRVIQRSRAQRVVLLLDCCYGGAFERGVVARAAGSVDVGDQFRQRQLGQGRGRVVITASTAMEYAFEGAQLADGSAASPSIFTGALVEGIRTGDADRDQDGHVALGELYDYVYDRVRERTPNQTPSKWEFGLRGELYVARNPNRRVPATRLAPELLDLIRHPVAAVRLAAVHELAGVAADDDPARAAEAHQALQRLTDDDSRQVSAAATAALTPTAPVVPPDPSPTGPRPDVPPAGSRPDVPPAGSRPDVPPAGSRPDPPSTDPRPDPPSTDPRPDLPSINPPTDLPTANVRPDAPSTGTQPGPPAGPAVPDKSDSSGRLPVRRSVAAQRLRYGLRIGAIMALLGVIGVVLIWVGNRATRTDGNPGDTGAARDYAGLLTMLPEAIRGSCRPGQIDPGSSAAAGCQPGAYELWDTKEAMDQDQVASAGFGGTCTTAPTVEQPAAVPLADVSDRGGRLSCVRNDPHKSPGSAYYVVAWAVDGLLLTGTFISTSGASEQDYQQLYEKALDMLGQLP
ncbi:caspase family protein [Paractinoplanes rishiriensis]|uniref:Peptidase C14 caspase domain-containing protein n=1 Tax=Paractinoplanes rishiriensis TaxID=1050105 RepID=A0A919MVL4_9ACTN|nr:caspase family protein [Actinoplanes rishiriensis]GIE93740.1 hypothetical protein Ari01nite_12050 [Actinoplanes rishiriensis]